MHAAVLYSDAISIEPIASQVDGTFRQGGISEDGGSYDIENQSASSNIFTTYAVKPGTRFVQTLVMLGNRMTRHAFDHLLLSIGVAGAYGGATAVTGTNLQSHLAGVYWGTLEQSINAPLHMLAGLESSMSTHEVIGDLARRYEAAYNFAISSDEATEHLQSLMEQLDQKDAALLRQYGQGAHEAAELFDAWFKGDKNKNKRGNNRSGNGTAPEVTP